MSERKNIVVIGGGIAGQGVSHYVLKHILRKLPQNGAGYHVYLVTPDGYYYNRVAAPRAVADANAMPTSQIFLPLTDGFKQYSKDSFTLLQATATGIDTAARVLTVKNTETEKEETLPYHALVIATGTNTSSPAFATTPSSAEARVRLEELRSRVKSAKTILIGGGGPVGVEVAGELGEALNGKPGWFQSKPSGPLKAQITLYSGHDRLFSILRPAIAKQAEQYLARVGVTVVNNNIKISSATATADGTTTVKLSNGDSKTVDLYIPAMGVTPNTSFLPDSLLNERGYVRTNHKTLRVDDAGARVYAAGDVGSHTRGGIMDFQMAAMPVIFTNMERDLVAAATDEKGKPAGKDRVYEPHLKESQLVPIGTGKGVGAMFGFRVPSFFVWMLKGRDYFASMAWKNLDGKQYSKEVKWNSA